MHDRNAGVPDDRQIKFRIGINVGDIIVEGDDFYGDGVNLASRLEALAGPGGIACSAMVRHQIGNKLKIEFVDQGVKTVKNLTQPVHVYLINLGPPKGTSPTAAPPGQDTPAPILCISAPWQALATSVVSWSALPQGHRLIHP